MTKSHALIVAAGTVVLCLSAAALIPASTDLRPKQVLLLRHAEEPKDGPTLNDEGRARAQMLAQWIPATFGRVDHLFAAKNSKQSSRSVETIEPLSAKTGLVIDQRFDDAEFEELVKLLKTSAYAGKTVVVCWHSEQMAKLARSLGASKAPADWPSSQYDHLWQLSYADTGVRFKDIKYGAALEDPYLQGLAPSGGR